MGRSSGMVERTCAVVGTVFVVATFYITAAPYFYWWPAPQGPVTSLPATIPVSLIAPAWMWFFGLLGLGLLTTAWLHFILRQKSAPGVINFSQTRRALDQKHSSIEKRFEGHSSVWCIWTIGTRFFDAVDKQTRVVRLLLPNPDSEFAKYYFQTIGQEHALPLIRATTEKARKFHVDVRWCDHYPFHAITLIDPHVPSGWALIESTLPYCTTERRPSYEISNTSAPETMEMLIQTFEALWGESSPAPIK